MQAVYRFLLFDIYSVCLTETLMIIYFTFLRVEGGLHLSKGTNLSGDVLVFDKQTLTPNLIDTHHLNIPPIIDVEIDNTTFSDFDYIQRKTDNLLKFGTQKVIWILTKTQKIIVAEPNKDWLLIDWQKDVEITNGITFNVPQYLKKEGVFIQ